MIEKLESAVSEIKMRRPDLTRALDRILDEAHFDPLLRSYEKIKGDARNYFLLEKLKPESEKRIFTYLMKLNALRASQGSSQMGAFWDIGEEQTPEQERNLGLDLLQSYYDEAKQFPEFSYSVFEEFIGFLESKVPDYPRNVGQLVLMNVASTTPEQAKSRLRDLARKSRGTASVSQIIQASGGSGDTINWWQAVPEVATETAKGVVEQAIKVAEATGEGVLATLKLTKYLPVILLGAGAFYIYLNKSKKA